MLYQQDIRDMKEIGPLGIETVDIRQNQAASQTILDMEILDGADGLGLMIDYAASRYNDSSMEHFRDLFVNAAQTLLKCGSEPEMTTGGIKERIRNNAGVSGAGPERKK